MLNDIFITDSRLDESSEIENPFTMCSKLVQYCFFFSAFLLLSISLSKSESEFNPCCSLPCLHQGICSPTTNVSYECDCINGYYGTSCEKATFKQWLIDKFKPTELFWQRFASKGKLFWFFVNNIPILHQAALRQFYQIGGDVFSNCLTWDRAGQYPTLENNCQDAKFARGLPPVHLNCPRPVGTKGPEKLPSADLIFEKIFERKYFKPCPHGSNLIFAAFAQQISHQILNAENNGHLTDLSIIYGKDDVTKHFLRSGLKGKLKSSIINGEEFPPYLPDNLKIGSSWREFEKSKLLRWFTGLKQPSLTPISFVMSTIWLREHNRVCQELSEEHPDWNDERLYQTAKNVILGELLTIVVSDFTQHLLQINVELGYRPELLQMRVQPLNIKLQHEFKFLLNWYQVFPDILTIRGHTYDFEKSMRENNRFVFEQGFEAVVDAMGRSPAGEMTYLNNGKFYKNVTKALIEESRKHRLHSFNTYRRSFDLKPYETFEELVGNDKYMVELLEKLYGDVDAVEFFVGFAVEKHRGTVLPPTMISLVGPFAMKTVMSNVIGSPNLWRPVTFGGKRGFDTVKSASLKTLFCRNLKGKCKNNVWIAFRTPKNVHYKTKHFITDQLRPKEYQNQVKSSPGKFVAILS